MALNEKKIKSIATCFSRREYNFVFFWKYFLTANALMDVKGTVYRHQQIAGFVAHEKSDEAPVACRSKV